MAVTSKLYKDNKELVISVDDRFDFSLHQEFRDSYNSVEAKGYSFILDLSQTEYMDSSALGMILLLKDHVQLNAGKLIVSKPNDTVKKILEIAQFQRLMTIQ